HQPTLTFRVTGAASVARLEPLLLDQDEGKVWQARWSRAVDNDGEDGDSGSHLNGGRIDFVWETTVKKEEVRRHRNARVLNRLSGAQVLEDKANLVLLQRLMTAPTLESYAVIGRGEVARWAHGRFERQRNQWPEGTPRDPPEGEEDWWCVKAAGGNGGLDVWVLHEGNWKSVTYALSDHESYVIQ
ncbi:unnamed protein product, partial [Hapterophycus canaliculatus]